MPPIKLVGAIYYEPLLRSHSNVCSGSIGISINLISFWEESIENKIAEGGHFEKNSHPKSLWMQYLMNHCLDHTKILCSGCLGISNDLITFWEESIKNKRADE